MPLEKQGIQINFSQGLDQKTDPNQVQLGKFLSLKNTVFNKGGLLQKRNGFKYLTDLPDDSYRSLSIYNNNLVAFGDKLAAYSQDTATWFEKGNIIPVTLGTQPLVRTASSQQSVDAATSTNNLICTTWQDSNGSYYYKIIDNNNGNVIVQQTALASGAVQPRVYLLGNYFIISYLQTITGAVNLRYIAISTSNVTMVTSPVSLTTLVKTINSIYDGQVINGQIYFAWDAADVGGAIRVTTMNQYLTQIFTFIEAAQNATKISIAGDTTGSTPIIWVSYFNSSNNAFTMAFNQVLGQALPPTQILTSVIATHIASTAQNGVVTVYYDTTNTYSYNSVRTDYLSYVTCTDLGVVGTPTLVIRGVGITTKAFLHSGTPYIVVFYGGQYQPTNFLIEALTGKLVAKLSYSNSSGYISTVIMPNVIVDGDVASFGYLFKSQVISVNKSQGVDSVGGIYGQLGINLATITFETKTQAIELGGSLILNGGYVRMYDGVLPVELGFHLWPEDLGDITSSTGGFMTAQIYNYQAVYEWTDAQGNIHRSAPSLPLVVDLSASMTSTNSVTVNVPTLRMTDKTSINLVRIVLYRWSTAQQNFYQVTSITSPLLNNTAVDSVSFTDTQADTSIIGNSLIYTTGGVIENIAPPAAGAMTLFKSRLFLIDSENTNTAWFSKVVVQNTPVEMSDLFTKFVAPIVSAAGQAGPLRTLYAMDDKLIAFKKDTPYYMTGNGPDNTGANDDFSEFIFITSVVGCENQFSMVFIPSGVVFQSDKGRWLLGRDLSTKYIGAPVENFGDDDLSAITVPGTNQVRITTSNDKTLMYDYYYDQWGEFAGIPGISSTVFEGLHTFLNDSGQVYQETPNLYVDGSQPVLISFTTSWINLVGLQGYQRAYFFYMLGKFYSPHKAQMSIAYDFFPGIFQSSVYTPNNYATDYGDDPLYGSSTPYGGTETTTEQFRVFLEKQKCESFQINFQEIYDASYGVPAGFGLTLSGINLVVAAKSRYPRVSARQSVG